MESQAREGRLGIVRAFFGHSNVKGGEKPLELPWILLYLDVSMILLTSERWKVKQGKEDLESFAFFAVIPIYLSADRRQGVGKIFKTTLAFIIL
jgi:hypothetical protein